MLLIIKEIYLFRYIKMGCAFYFFFKLFETHEKSIEVTEHKFKICLLFKAFFQIFYAYFFVIKKLNKFVNLKQSISILRLHAINNSENPSKYV